MADDALHRTGPIGEHPVCVMDLRTAIKRYAHQQEVLVLLAEPLGLLGKEGAIGGDGEMDLAPPVSGIGGVGGHHLGQRVGADHIQKRNIHEAVATDEIDDEPLLICLAEHRIRIIKQSCRIGVGKDVVDEGLGILHR